MDKLLSKLLSVVLAVLVVAAFILVLAVLGIGLNLARADNVENRLKAVTFRYSVGTGFFVVGGTTGNRYILTNQHVCQDGHVQHVYRESVEADLCAVKAEEYGPYLIVADVFNPGEDVYSYGYGLGKPVFSIGTIGDDFTWKTKFGCEEGQCIYRKYTSSDTTLYSVPGSSGSPVVNELGRLVGVVSSYDYANSNNAGIVRFADVRKFVGGL